ncbi:hypothetical protein BKA70DRAFT_875370 [Coprinopsis sp. MPI-PUGE-AT-0042]|nr:hypothetical protein BKA70DRAFT_875370 [Coprinopsis sp. MPI-PUGE-AT-0042]
MRSPHSRRMSPTFNRRWHQSSCWKSSSRPFHQVRWMKVDVRHSNTSSPSALSGESYLLLHPYFCLPCPLSFQAGRLRLQSSPPSSPCAEVVLHEQAHRLPCNSKFIEWVSDWNSDLMVQGKTTLNDLVWRYQSRWRYLSLNICSASKFWDIFLDVPTPTAWLNLAKLELHMRHFVNVDSKKLGEVIDALHLSNLSSVFASTVVTTNYYPIGRSVTVILRSFILILP